MEIIQSFQNGTASHYWIIKHLEALAERYCMDQKQNRILFQNNEYVSMLQNVVHHTDISTTELVISKQAINPLYCFSHCIHFF